MSQKRSWNFWAGAAIVGLFAAYALWNARDLIGGVSLTVEAPSVVEGASPVVTLSGSVSRGATRLSVNGLPIRTDERGFWETERLLLPGQNVFLFEVLDRFGERETTRRIVWYLPR